MLKTFWLSVIPLIRIPVVSTRIPVVPVRIPIASIRISVTEPWTDKYARAEPEPATMELATTEPTTTEPATTEPATVKPTTTVEPTPLCLDSGARHYCHAE